MTYQNPKTVYACINLGEAVCPDAIAKQSICINTDLAGVITALKEAKMKLKQNDVSVFWKACGSFPQSIDKHFVLRRIIK